MTPYSALGEAVKSAGLNSPAPPPSFALDSIAVRLCCLLDHANSLHSQTMAIADRAFGAIPVMDSAETASIGSAGEIGTIEDLCTKLGRSLSNLQGEIERLGKL